MSIEEFLGAAMRAVSSKAQELTTEVKDR
jgi:hypothetical protein